MGISVAQKDEAYDLPPGQYGFICHLLATAFISEKVAVLVKRLLELDSGLRAASKDLRCYPDISGVKCEGERQGCRPPISLAMELFEVLHKTSPEVKERRLS